MHSVTKSSCERVPVPVDLRDDWSSALLAAGFERDVPAVWLVEGLLPYLRPEGVTALLARVSALAAEQSELLLDVPGTSVLDSPHMKERLEFVAGLGAPWQFATDEPETLLEPLGWDVRVIDAATIGQRHGRWPFPAFPRGTPGVPQNFFVHGVKRVPTDEPPT